MGKEIKKKLLIDQPGHFGDILICLPIAKWYSNEYEIDWFCPQEYHSIFENITYCKPIINKVQSYDKIIDISFGLRKGELHNWWKKNQSNWQSFIIPKYILSNVPLKERWNLQWIRNINKENDLYDKIVAINRKDYILSHDINIKENVVYFKKIDDFNVFDWYKVILNSKEIHCIDSLLCNFVDIIPEALNIKKIYYQTKKAPNYWDRTILINNWIWRI